MVVTTAEGLLDAALVATARHGTRLSMEEIARTAGVSRQTVYRNFPSKAALLEALGAHVQRRLDETIHKAVAPELEPSAQLDAGLRAMVGFLNANVGQHLVDIEPAFMIKRLRRSLGGRPVALEKALGPALEAVPAVRSGAATVEGLADLLVRVAVSHFLFPHPDSDVLLATLRALLVGGGSPTGPGRGRGGTC